MKTTTGQLSFDVPERENTEALIRLAIAEDFGDAGDRTSDAIIPASATGDSALVARSEGILSGLPVLRAIAAEFGLEDGLVLNTEDGARLEPDQEIARLSGSRRQLLAMERLALNFLQRLSGIATLTHAFVQRVKHTKAKILDTRKTTPGWRFLEKYAVRCGGGVNHRSGLHDAIMIKDNHLAWLLDVEDPISTAISRARAATPAGMIVEIEVDTLDQFDRAINARPDIILLDNFQSAEHVEAVRRRDRIAPDILLEASGGINLKSVQGVAETGVDRISVGAITHSAVALDLGLDDL